MASMRKGSRVIARSANSGREYMATVVAVDLVSGTAEVKLDTDRDTTRIDLVALTLA